MAGDFLAGFITPERLAQAWVPAILLMGAGTVYFYASTNATRKRRYFKPFMLGSAVVALGFAWLWGAPIVLVVPIALILVVTTLHGAKSIRFCDTCGATTVQVYSSSGPQHCSQCGEKLPHAT